MRKIMTVLNHRKSKAIVKQAVGVAVCFLVTLAMILPTIPAKADESYNYMVRIYAGKEGTFASGGTSKNGVVGTVEDGGSAIIYRDVQPGDVIAFQADSVQLNEGSKYYIKEIRESGKDNYDLEYPQLSAFTVDGDDDYVVAYALLGSSVSYTINYVDANGKELIPSQTFYGNIGDKPVIAYRYVENYFPQAYNLTGELSEDASKNVFTFVYQEVKPTIIPAEDETSSETETPAAGEGETTPAGTEGGNEDAGGAGAGDNGAAGAGGGAVNLPGTGLNGGNLPNDPNGTQQLIDINGGAVPTTNGGNGTNNGGNGTEPQTDVIGPEPTPTAGGNTLSWVLAGVGIVAAVALIIALIVFFAKKNKKK